MNSRIRRIFKISDSSLSIHFLASFLLIVLFIVCGSILFEFNIRRPTSLNYNEVTYTNEVDADLLKGPNGIFLADDWILIPNVGLSDLYENGHIRYEKFQTIQHFENVKISPSGWIDLGEDCAYFINLEEKIEFNKAIYMMRLHFLDTSDIYYLNIPSVNGTGYVYINGEYVDMFGSETKTGKSFFDFNCGNLNVAINENHEEIVELVIFVDSEFNVDKGGITAYPSIGNYATNNRYNIFVNAWFFFEVAIFLMSAVGSLILSQTFRYKAKRYLFVGTIIVMLAYICIDNNYLSISTHARNTALFMLLITHLAMSYAFVTSIFSYQSEYKSFVRRWHDTFVVILLSVALIIPEQLRVDKSASYSDLNVVKFFIVICSALLLGKTIYIILLDKKREKNSVLALFSALSTFFIYLTIVGEYMYVYYIPIYSVFYTSSLICLQIIFIIYYVLQFNELAHSKENLERLVTIRTEQLSKANENLRKTNEDLLDNELARKNVMSNISHDLKTPITAIKGYAQLLSTESVVNNPEQVTSYSENIIRRANQMERLIADIIELTKLQSGGMAFKFIPLSVSQMLEETYYMYEPDVSMRGKTLELDIPEDDYLMVDADPNKLVRIFENLISNAMHYTNEDGKIKIKAFRRGDKKSGDIIIEVSDNGIGIPEEDVSHIFDRFYRAKNSGINIKGTGLGLAIVKLIADKHNATIEVDSVINEGTTFRLICPAQKT
ncbi:MAG: HAMP domain-containing histidine kinase [Clostridia bacterium]|nr:HAMP domain-containing histidine kinase [Clostridia bacterium]